MAIVTLSNNVEIDTDKVDEVKKLEGDNAAYYIFMQKTSEGRLRYMGTQEDVDAISEATGKDHQKRRDRTATPAKKNGKKKH